MSKCCACRDPYVPKFGGTPGFITIEGPFQRWPIHCQRIRPHLYFEERYADPVPNHRPGVAAPNFLPAVSCNAGPQRLAARPAARAARPAARAARPMLRAIPPGPIGWMAAFCMEASPSWVRTAHGSPESRRRRRPSFWRRGPASMECATEATPGRSSRNPSSTM